MIRHHTVKIAPEGRRVKKIKVLSLLSSSARARGQPRASRNHKALVFSWIGRPQALRLPLRKPIGFANKGNSQPVLSRRSRPIQASSQDQSHKTDSFKFRGFRDLEWI